MRDLLPARVARALALFELSRRALLRVVAGFRPAGLGLAALVSVVELAIPVAQFLNLLLVVESLCDLNHELFVLKRLLLLLSLQHGGWHLFLLQDARDNFHRVLFVERL